MYRCTFGTSCSLCDYIRTPLPISIAEFGFTWQSRLFREASCRNSRGWSFRSFASERETIAWSDVIKIRFEYPWKGVCMWEGGRERERERWVGGGDEMTSRTFSFKSFNRPAYYRLSSFSLVLSFLLIPFCRLLFSSQKTSIFISFPSFFCRNQIGELTKLSRNKFSSHLSDWLLS